MSKAHPGFEKVAAGIAKKQGVPVKEADAELAASSRNASKKAKKKNPALKKVKGTAVKKKAMPSTPTITKAMGGY